MNLYDMLTDLGNRFVALFKRRRQTAATADVAAEDKLIAEAKERETQIKPPVAAVPPPLPTDKPN